MDSFYLNIAGFNIEIIFHPASDTSKILQRQILSEYKCFLVNKGSKSDYIVNFYDIEHHIKRLTNDNTQEFITIFFKVDNKNEISTYYYISLSMFMHLLSFIIIDLLAKKNGFILHASASNFNNSAVIFTGDSGSGKSTSVDLLRNQYKGLEDDRIIIRNIKEKYYLFHSPFLAKPKWIRKNTRKYPIRKIIFLQKSSFFQIRKLRNKNSILSLLIPQLICNKENIKKNISTLSNFINLYDKFYLLKFAKNMKKMLKFSNERISLD